ncbi:nucleoside hydrolase-like domain-containing protein [Paenibacillus aurantius]|uniref:nucleoside hydrolase-like domain-containing protein n=1 Tax=Paenibacillus aurantius TaxID=2918900 RepID=UPI00387F5D9D
MVRIPLTKGALNGERYRVIVSTDIGGSDPDDFQSLVHYLLYSDLFDTEGLISSPWSHGRKEHILEVIDQYERDYLSLRAHSENYPDPHYLRSISKQGTIDFAPYRGFSNPTEGSDWIIHCARKKDERPLYLLVWGLLEDLAQALHDDPGIQDKLRVYYIGGPNKKWGLNAYEYIRENFPKLWIIENNSTYRGWFVGGNQENDLGNDSFVANHISGHGALGEYFAKHLNGSIKMGDTPSVAYLLKGNPEDPEQPGWGGRFTKVLSRPAYLLERNTGKEDRIEIFGVLELVFRGPDPAVPTDRPVFFLVVEEQEFEGFYCGEGKYRVRYMPKRTGLFSYATKSEIPELDGQTGEFTCVGESPARLGYDPDRYPHWWSDLLESDLAEASHKGAKTVSMWRESYLRDFQSRMDRCL